MLTPVADTCRWHSRHAARQEGGVVGMCMQKTRGEVFKRSLGSGWRAQEYCLHTHYTTPDATRHTRATLCCVHASTTLLRHDEKPAQQTVAALAKPATRATWGGS